MKKTPGIMLREFTVIWEEIMMKGFFQVFLGYDLWAQLMINRTGEGGGEKQLTMGFFTLKYFGYLPRAFPLSPDLFPPAAWHLMKQITVMNKLLQLEIHFFLSNLAEVRI